jgi:sterol desaturase/sphingolipid hydroxylase (fatty acid hydroxylase superfamily)
MLETIWQTLLQTPNYLFDANKRIFIGYSIAALVIAMLLYFSGRAQQKKRTWRGLGRYLFSKRIWLSKSAKLDYQLLIINRLLKAALWVPIVLTMVPVAIGVSDALQWLFGERAVWQLPSTVVLIIFTVLLFIFDDLTRFLLHLALHKVPFLWHFHKVHHSALVLTPMTIYRSHPFESYLYACRMALAQGLVVGVCVYCFGRNLSMLDILGANVFVFAFNALGANLRHSHVWWSFGKKIENWLISPAQHQIHHSDNPKHFDRNLGSALAIWDRACGTLIKAHQVGKITVGVGNNDRGHNSVMDAYWRPIYENLQTPWQRVAKAANKVNVFNKKKPIIEVNINDKTVK